MAIKMGRVVFGASVIALATAIGAQAAMAQDTANAPVAEQPTPAETAAATQEIVVTGSRLANSGFSAPTPVTVVGAQEIARQGATNVSEVLNQVPAFRAQNTPQTSANFASNLGASTADLRGLGANRTLVLIDGRRVVAATTQGSSTTPANAVDLNMIPTSLIARSEVVTGGASAQYGSDAVAGVVNIILDTKLEGFRGSLQYGITDRSDGKDYAASFGFGTKIGDRGHLIFGVDYDNNKGVGDCYTRSWCRNGYAPVSVPFANRAAAGGASQILQNPTTATASYNGLINGANPAGLTAPQLAAANAAVQAAGLTGTEFGSNGTTFRHNYGTYYGIGLFQSGGGDGVNPYFQNFALSTPVRKIASYAHFNYDLSDSISAFVDLSYADVRGHNYTSQNRDANIVIRADNPYLPAATAAAIAAIPAFGPNGVAGSVQLGRIGQDFGAAYATVQRNTFRTVGGLEGKLGGNWKWNAYYQYGETNYHQQQSNNKINANYTKAIDAVRGPNGSVICRVNSLTDFIPGTNTVNTANDDPACTPLNIFGQNNWSQQAKNYAFGTATQDTKITQNVASVSISGDLADLWAGPLSVAAGGEYRRDSAQGTADPISTALGFYTSPGSAISGKVNVKEGFVEAGLPLAKDAPFARELALNGAVRATDYSTSGTVWSWKAGVTYEPVQALRFRVTRSRDIRAPNIFELYGPQQSSFSSVVDPLNNGSQGLPQVINGGNANLKPEIAKTWTIGGVLQPNFWGLNRLRFSVDYYDINLVNAVSTYGAQLIVNLCAQGQTAFCSGPATSVTRAGGLPTGTITQIVNLNLNLNKVHTNGLDFELAYSQPLESLGLGGTLSIRALATRAIHLTTTDATGAKIDRANQIGAPTSQLSGVPRWQGNLFLTYASGPFSGTAQVRYVSKGVKDATLFDPSQDGYAAAVAIATNSSTTSINHAPGYAVVNLNASYAIINDGPHKVELFGVVNNVLDKDPPNYLNSSFGPTNNVLYDVLGRNYRIGVRVAF